MNYERLKTIREELGYSQHEMAQKLGVSKSNYARWETGEKIIPLKHLVHLCNYSKTSLDYALGLANFNPKFFYSIKYNALAIGFKIKKIRLSNQLTQIQFANSIHTTQSVISNYENGYTLIQTAFLYNICTKYKVSADDVIFWNFVED